jgi:hypothetical protein
MFPLKPFFVGDIYLKKNKKLHVLGIFPLKPTFYRLFSS